MNLLLVTQRYHPYVGGIETHVRQIAHGLGRDHRVSVAAVNFTRRAVPQRLAMLDTSLLVPPHTDFCDGPIPVHALVPRPLERWRLLPIVLRATPILQRRYYHQLERFGYGWYRQIFLPKLRQLCQEVDLVHALAGGYLGWAAQEAAHERDLPFVCTPFVHPHQWGDGPHDVHYYQQCDGVVALVETDRQYLGSLGVRAERLHVIGVSPDLPASCAPEPFRQRHGLGTAPIVLYVGRMMPQKGAAAVLQAAPLVWRQVPEARFVFIGPPGRESPDWFVGADPRVLYLGQVSAQEKADALAACSVFCMPSLSEILPTVYLEAWTMAKPVVGGIAPGLPALVEGNGAGVCVPQKPERVAQVLVELLRDPQRGAAMGRQGQQLVQSRYAVAAVTGALSELYRNLTMGKPRQLRPSHPAEPLQLREYASVAPVAPGVGNRPGL